MRNKEKLIRQFNEAFANSDTAFILDNMSEDIVWHLIGDRSIEGKEAVRQSLEEMEQVETLNMDLSGIVIQGETAAAHGSMRIKKSSGEIKSFGFADVYEFSGSGMSKIRKMTSYVIPLKEQ